MSSQIMVRQLDNRRLLLQVPLVLVLLLQIFYYPLSNTILSPFLATHFPNLESSSRTIVALTVAVLVLFTLVVSLLVERSSIHISNSRFLVRQPETWLIVALLWIIPVTVMNLQSTSTQNLTVYFVVIAILLQCRLGTQLVSRTLKPIVLITSGLLIFAGLLGLLNEGVWKNWAILAIGSNPRLYATYGVIAICLMFAISIENKIRFPILALLYACIVMSESRTALGAALIVIGLGVVFISRRPLLAGIGVGIGVLVTFVVTLSLPFISSRMSPSDITTPGSPIDDSGRIVVWRAVIESFSGSPLVGQGAGSGQTVALASDFPLEHPHSEYLRVLHDGGIIGAFLVGVALILMLVLLRPRRNGAPSHPHVVGGFLLLCAGLSMGTIENFLVFPSLMWPGAVILGLALSTQREQSLVSRTRTF